MYFQELLESQFERNTTFRSKIVGLSAESLRLNPIGRDRLGHTYWITKDNDCNVQIYQEHLDEEIWRVVAKNRLEFVNLIKNLQNNERIPTSEDTPITEGEDEDATNTTSTYSEGIPTNGKDQQQFLNQAVHAADDKDVVKADEDDEEYDFVQKVPNLRIKLGSGCASDLLNNDLTIIDASSELPLRLLKSPSVEEQQRNEDDSSFEGAEQDGDVSKLSEELALAEVNSKDPKVVLSYIIIIIVDKYKYIIIITA